MSQGRDQKKKGKNTKKIVLTIVLDFHLVCLEETNKNDCHINTKPSNFCFPSKERDSGGSQAGTQGGVCAMVSEFSAKSLGLIMYFKIFKIFKWRSSSIYITML